MPRKPQDFGKSFETFSHEVKDFWASRAATCMIWIGYILLNTANLAAIICSASPYWGITMEVVGQGRSHDLEGEVIGYYGVWYNCYESVMGYGTTCIKWSELEFHPDWWAAFQSMMTLSFICGFACFMILSFYMFARTLNRNKRILAIFMAVNFFTIAFAITGFVVFCVLFLKDSYWCCHPDLNREFIHYRLYWCFELACVMTGLYMLAFVAGLLEYMDILKEERIELEFEIWRQKESRMQLNYTQYTYDPSFQNAAMMGYGNMWR